MSGISYVMDGSPSSGEQLQADRELVVYGQGIGSTVDLEVSTADVRGCAAGLRAIATELRAATQRVRLAALATSSTSHLSAGGPGAVDEAWLLAADGEQRAAAIEELAGRLEAAAAGYEAAEAANLAQVWQIARPPWVINLFTPGAHAGIAWGLAFLDGWLHGQWVPTRDGIGMALGETVWSVSGLDDGVGSTAQVVAGAMALVTSSKMRVERVDVPGSGPGSHAAVSDVEGVVEAIDGLYPDNGSVPFGTVRVDRVTGADGSTSWLVLVPGTQGSLVSSHGFDWSSNPGGMVGDTTASVATVLLAMQQASIQPGQPVVLAGHSQGGFVALNAANAVAGRYNVTGVISVGSPTGRLQAPEETEVLSIEHVEDPVPGLDDAANPVGENWTVVERDLHTSVDPEIADIDGPWGSHDTPTYADTAELIDASDDGAITDFLGTVSDVLDPDATAESSYYQGTRVP